MPKPLRLKGTIRVNAPLRGGMMASRVFGHGGACHFVLSCGSEWGGGSKVSSDLIGTIGSKRHEGTGR